MLTGKIIYGVLSASTAVKAIVGTNFYPIVAPQGVEVPLVTFRTIQRLPSPAKDTVSKLDTYDVEINCYHHDYTSLCSLVAAIRTALDRYYGTVAGVNVQHCVYENGTEGYIEDGNYFFMQENYKIRVAL